MDGCYEEERRRKVRGMLSYSVEGNEEWSRILFEKLWPTMVFIGVLIAVGVPGNLLVFCVYLKRFRPSAARVFILAMAVCDFLTNVISLPLMIFHLKYFFNSVDNPTCKFMHVSWRFTTVMSTGLLVCVAIDRHRRICFPFKQQITHRQAILILPFVVTITVMLLSPFVVFFGKMHWDNSSVICFIEDQYVESPWVGRTTMFLIAYVALLVIILMICYTHIVCRVQRLKMNRQRICKNQPNKDDQHSKFSSDYNKPQEALDSQNISSHSDANKDSFSVISSPETSSEETSTQTTQESLKTVLNEQLLLEIPTASTPAIETTVTLQMSDNLIMKNTTSPHQRDDLTSENLPTLRDTEQEMKVNEQNKLAKKDRGRKQGRFSKTTLMMLVLTLTSIVLFIPHLIIELWLVGCLYIDYPFLKINSCQVADLFPYLSSVINPFIYSFCNPKFRLQCRLFLRDVCQLCFARK
ncbi:muscarinic acetylcholine receptor M2-like [Pomacea canaliculata]|uniref:muscarinic acetylcholine receptor M2-like n=1 Tax=Pomacea canaliculata TaxID=400727 RepID=UPI000D72C9F3|nr:muscarinic acetylcholine receptor M2-like [Pomacea canaliculata]